LVLVAVEGQAIIVDLLALTLFLPQLPLLAAAVVVVIQEHLFLILLAAVVTEGLVAAAELMNQGREM